MDEQVICTRCKQVIPPSPHGFTNGYGENDKGEKFCYPCCAELDKEHMTTGGKIVLYLVWNNLTDQNELGRSEWEVTNWPGSLRFRAWVKIAKSRRAIWSRRIDAWFYDMNRNLWYGRLQDQYGQAVIFRRLKHKQ